MKKKLLFLCSGNYYRSRYAEIYFNHVAGLKKLPWEAFSRGFTAATSRNVGPISVHAIEALESIGLYAELSRFPVQLVEEDLAKADKIIALKEAEHRPLTQKNFPSWENQIEFWTIHDIDVDVPAKALPELRQQLDEFVQSLEN